ncbi:BMP-binding endothelial regulator protein-like [Latimeria chalumnae]|uniref:BMP-binding endothelial regulator protein-like n=1 Tax=Latimeria chalumnae TaxID=7897 RepID=UPI00313C8B77
MTKAGLLACHSIVCRLLAECSSEHTVLEEGACCPTCKEVVKVITLFLILEPEWQFTFDPDCKENNITYRNGTTFKKDSCAKCTCLDRKIICVSKEEYCPQLNCSLSQQTIPEGQCCPACMTSEGCVYKGQTYQENAYWVDGCNECACRKTQVVCHLKLCFKPVTCPEGQILQRTAEKCCRTCLPKNSTIL